MPPSVLQLALCCDRNVADGRATAIASASRHLSEDWLMDVHVIDCGLGDEIRQRLASMASEELQNTRLHFVTLDAERLAGFPKPAGLDHVTPAAYARLFLHELLPGVSRLIYLDCDLLVARDLVELFDFPLGAAPLAAAVDTVIPTVGHDRESLVADVPGIDPSAPYFNSGVLLLNLAELRRIDATRLYADATRRVAARYADQSILNAVFHGQWRPLSPDWNRQTLLGPDFSVFPDRPHAIWHFSSKLKPWHFARATARGLLAQWHAERSHVSWLSTTAPTHTPRTPWVRDTLKHARSTLACLRGATQTPAKIRNAEISKR